MCVSALEVCQSRLSTCQSLRSSSLQSYDVLVPLMSAAQSHNMLGLSTKSVLSSIQQSSLCFGCWNAIDSLSSDPFKPGIGKESSQANFYFSVAAGVGPPNDSLSYLLSYFLQCSVH
mmetsp:Transcript_24806/g.36371  ORF Transcript_24806/g.36371 Transcript_24806/m.36371 type:complete len:117 (-) Transcript_24806:478-828(-)